jgi:hypothetical protein
VTLEQRVRLCIPSLERLVHQEEMSIYQRYAERQSALLIRNQELFTAGLVDEMGAASFDLTGRVSLASRKPYPPPLMLGEAKPRGVVLPLPTSGAEELAGDAEAV